MTPVENKQAGPSDMQVFRQFSSSLRKRSNQTWIIGIIGVTVLCTVLIGVNMLPNDDASTSNRIVESLSQRPCTVHSDPSAPVVVPFEYAKNYQRDMLDKENFTFVLQHDMNTSFFFTEDNYEKGIEAIRNYLELYETKVRFLFRHLLHRPSCEADLPNLAKWGAGCAVDPASKPKGKKQIMIDVGSNRGYYSMMSASYGLEVHAFDPQPHCALFVRAALLMNGFTNRLHFRHMYVSTNVSQPMMVRKRTGCSGKFPNDKEDGWGPHLQERLREFPGADEEVAVHGTRLDDIFNGRMHDVALMKIDVEGHEFLVLRSARKLLESGAVRNLIIEVNIPMMGRQADGLEKTARGTRRVVRWLMHDLGYSSKVTEKGLFSEQPVATDADWDSYLDPENKSWGGALEAWFFKPGL